MWIYIFLFVMALSCLLSLGLGIYSWRYRTVPGARAFTAVIASGFIWVLFSLISMLSATPEAAVFWNIDVRYIGVIMAPVVYLLFVLEYTGYKEWLTWRRIWIFFVVPLLSLVFLWTPGLRSLFTDADAVAYGPVMLPDPVDGPWFWVHVVYGYLVTFIGLILVGLRIIGSQYPYRQQAMLIFIGSLLPFISSIPTILPILPAEFPPLDLTGLASIGMVITFGWALFRYRLLDVMPVARDAIIEGMEDGVIVLDTLNRVVDINPATESLLNLNRTAVVGQDIAACLDDLASLVGGFGDTREATAEYVIGSGEDALTFDVRVSTLYYKKQSPTGRLVVLRDITSRKRIEAERERLIAELDAYNRTVAHDLKNPLGLISNSVELLTMQYPDLFSGKPGEMLAIIERTSVRMTTIINELLLLASVRKQDSVDTAPLAMGAVVGGALERLPRLIQESGAQINLPDEWPEAVGYGPWVEEVWANYISNAVKYGGQPPVIDLGADRLGGMVRFWVRDNGKGISAEAQQGLFAEFTRLEQHKKTREGQGLGLSIARRIISKLSGEVGVESAPGQGSLFYFTLPAA